MGKIQLMDELLSNKIAAGEVVERPASVVKELVENAIDANSSRVDIYVDEAGLAKIRIVDNGDGIQKDDCELAFERHATSKIKDENDLFRIKTLGFRGEALPSIAAVASVEVITSSGTEAGTRLIIKGGELKDKASSHSRKGTEIIVTDLFFNTPARLKYLKTVHTELGNITDVVNRIAFAHPEVAISLAHNGKKLLQTNGNGDLLQVAAAIYGVAIAKKMVALEAKSLDFTVKGYIALPEVTRASRHYMSTLINGRFIKNYPLMKAIQAGYHTLLPIGRYPIAVLHIEMDPLLVDVNVHPAKLEVRLSKEKELNELIEKAIKDVFKEQQLIPSVSVQKQEKKVVKESQQQFTFQHELPVTKPRDLENNKDLSFDSTYTMKNKQTLDEDKKAESLELSTDSDNQPSRFSGLVNHTMTSETASGDHHQNEEILEVSEAEPTGTESTAFHDEYQEELQERVPPLYPIGQMHGTYILAQNDNGLYLIDQHAAQERINYEFFKEKVGQIAEEVQELLVPLTFEFSKAECLVIEENIEQLKQVGIFLEPFGPQGFIVRNHPQWFPPGQEQETIEDMLQQLLSSRKVDIKKLREEAAILMSCKQAIKANRHLRNDEIFALLETLRKTTDPFTCPHGRPIIIHFSTYEMEKMFKRVM